MSKKYPHLFSPITIGNMTVKNRIFQSAVGTHLATENYEVTKEHLAYFEERAKGGVGLITTECIVMQPDTRYTTMHGLGLFEDRMVDELKKITDLVHKYDVKMAAQIMHPSSVATPKYNSGKQPVAASPLECRAVGEISREITIPEIKQFIEDYGKAARRAYEAGFDAIEVHCCHGHGLLGRFLSPLENKRIDEYGGNIDGRLKLPLEVIREMRRVLPENFPIIVRMTSVDALDGGQSLMDARYIARQFEENGVSMIHMSYGTMNTPWFLTTPSGTPKAFNAERAEELKKAVNIPVAFIGKNNEAWVADMAIELGKCDAVYMGRTMLVDPQFPNKVKEGKEDEVRPCIGCNHCLVSINGDLTIRCTMNPEVGHELETKKSAAVAKKILVIGGGPAGLTAAAYAAEIGHNVDLVEKAARLGGQMYLAAFPPCKQEIAAGTKYMINRAKRAGVHIEINKDIDAEQIKSAGYDNVIVATGGTPIVPGFLKGANHCISAWDALGGKEKCGASTVIVGGGLVGCETADFLAHPVYDLNPKSRKITIIEMDETIAKEEKSSFRPLMIERILKKGCNVLTSAKVISVSGNVICYEQGGEMHEIKNVDTVVSAVGVRSENSIAEELRKIGIEPIVIGDATRARNIHSATEEAFAVVNGL